MNGTAEHDVDSAVRVQIDSGNNATTVDENRPPMSCTVLVSSDAPHVSQIYAGFDLLAQRGVLRARRVLARPLRTAHGAASHLRDSHRARVDVLFDHGPRVVYDMHDSWEVDSLALARADFLFKRSFSPESLLAAGIALSKVLPLGLNYHVITDRSDWLQAARALIWSRVWRESFASAATAFRALDRFAYAPRLSTYESSPDCSLEPRVLFVARAWDPAELGNAPADKIADRIAINDRRAACIRALRDRFGPKFVGGFIPSYFARATYPDLTDVPGVDGHKGRYLATARQIPICIATDGLHGSTGWKFAEYMAMARAIVSEPLRYVAPGDLAEGIHYLSFDSVSECVGHVTRLMEDRDLRFNMMTANASYYREFVRPDAIVRQSLRRVFGLQSI
jgi:hypothetical protein